MGWRFRKSFKVLPGVRLNLSRHGLSTTIGAARFSVNIGPRGVYRNLSIPGTGLSHRERLVAPSHSAPAGLHAPNHSVVPPPIPATLSNNMMPAGGTEIRSASTELINSHSLALPACGRQHGSLRRDADFFSRTVPHLPG